MCMWILSSLFQIMTRNRSTNIFWRGKFLNAQICSENQIPFNFSSVQTHWQAILFFLRNKPKSYNIYSWDKENQTDFRFEERCQVTANRSDLIQFLKNPNPNGNWNKYQEYEQLFSTILKGEQERLKSEISKKRTINYLEMIILNTSNKKYIQIVLKYYQINSWK